jgi:hypothetical protein
MFKTLQKYSYKLAAEHNLKALKKPQYTHFLAMKNSKQYKQAVNLFDRMDMFDQMDTNSLDLFTVMIDIAIELDNMILVQEYSRKMLLLNMTPTMHSKLLPRKLHYIFSKVVAFHACRPNLKSCDWFKLQFESLAFAHFPGHLQLQLYNAYISCLSTFDPAQIKPLTLKFAQTADKPYHSILKRLLDRTNSVSSYQLQVLLALFEISKTDLKSNAALNRWNVRKMCNSYYSNLPKLPLPTQFDRNIISLSCGLETLILWNKIDPVMLVGDPAIFTMDEIQLIKSSEGLKSIENDGFLLWRMLVLITLITKSRLDFNAAARHVAILAHQGLNPRSLGLHPPPK